MNSRKRQHNIWARELKTYLHSLQGDEPYCEMCNATGILDVAHSKKRRYIYTREDYFEAAVLCRQCHESIEYSGPDNMRRAIISTINAR